MRALFLVLMLVVSQASAHEMWLEPLDYQPAADSRIGVHIVNGQKFKGIRHAYIPRNFKTFVVINASQVLPVESRIGSMPALKQKALGDGLHVVAYQSEPDTVTYAKFKKFQAFADHKDFASIWARHLERGLPEGNFREIYTRFSKALIGAGSGMGEDRRLGLETEFVALDNPYTGDLRDGFRVQLFYGGKVRTNAQVEMFERLHDEEATITMHRTDVHGIATLPIRPGHDYMIDAVVLRQPDAETAKESAAVWESLWANMTFSVPDDR